MVIERCRIEKWRMFQRQMQKKTKEEKEPNLRSSAPLQLLFAKLFSLAPSTFQTVQNEKRERERTIPNQNIYKKKLPFKYLNSKKKRQKKEVILHYSFISNSYINHNSQYGTFLGTDRSYSCT